MGGIYSLGTIQLELVWVNRLWSPDKVVEITSNSVWTQVCCRLRKRLSAADTHVPWGEEPGAVSSLVAVAPQVHIWFRGIFVAVVPGLSASVPVFYRKCPANSREPANQPTTLDTNQPVIISGKHYTHTHTLMHTSFSVSGRWNALF